MTQPDVYRMIGRRAEDADRFGRDLRHLVNTVHDLAKSGVGFKVLSGQTDNQRPS
jgi:DNA invertase Pin-like site-specific DNA recombinase